MRPRCRLLTLTACLLSALALTRLWRISTGGRAIAIGLLLLVVALAVRDQYLQVNTLHGQPVYGAAEDQKGAVVSYRGPALP